MLWQLFLTFFKLGAFTFGGGYAMISLIENEVVDKRKWIDRDEMMDIVTIAESTPGPLAVNMATFVGTKVKGFIGALVATLGLIIPPFVIISVIALLLNEFKSNAIIAAALTGIQAGVVVLILNAFLKFFKQMDKKPLSFIFLIIAFLVALLTDFSVVLLILIGGVAGFIISAISMKIAKDKVALHGGTDGDNATPTDAEISDTGDVLDGTANDNIMVDASNTNGDNDAVNVENSDTYNDVSANDVDDNVDITAKDESLNTDADNVDSATHDETPIIDIDNNVDSDLDTNRHEEVDE